MTTEPLRTRLTAGDRRVWVQTLLAACDNTIDRLADRGDPHHRRLLQDVSDFRDRLQAELGVHRPAESEIDATHPAPQ